MKVEEQNGVEVLVTDYCSTHSKMDDSYLKNFAKSYISFSASEREKDKPDWLDKENPDWEGNYKVWYWEKDWQDIIFGNDNSYLKKILNAGFDGVYLDIIDAFEYYE